MRSKAVSGRLMRLTSVACDAVLSRDVINAH
jgi:hypothetical protein